MSDSLTYAKAGVDIDKANALVDQIKKIAKSTPRSGVMGDIGGFGGMYSLNVANMERPVLVSSTDGVGTKLKIAFMTGIHDTVGIDLVAMCINDIAVQGAKPLFFLDYLSMGRLDNKIATDIIKGIGKGCRLANCSLIGGETAEMPGFYSEKEYDLAGFAVGIVDNRKIVDGSDTQLGDKVIGIASNGLHSNGYSLVRKICFDMLELDVAATVPELGVTIVEELLKPTRIYSETIQRLLKDLPISGLAHITGGGLVDNIVRIIPKSCKVVLKKGSWEVPPIFSFLQKSGKISQKEMLRTFNNGIGLVLVVPERAVDDVLERLRGMKEQAFVIGEIAAKKKSKTQISWV